MDKNWKLQRYNRKDYSEVVDFPVEIVGRDGVVRRYSFEDSIRLYQRRITFAPIRYRDDDLIDAEVHHCRSRIDQLRRSYFHRFGWGVPEGAPDPADVFEDIAGEVAAFLCRTLQCHGRPQVAFTRVGGLDDNTTSIWYLARGQGSPGMLLYVYRFRGLTADAVRDSFFTYLRRLEMSGDSGGDGERLLAFHHSVDCGFVMTGRGDEFEGMLPAEQPSEPLVQERVPTPWDDALELIRRGLHQRAQARCKELVRSQPWHRRAYIAGAMVSMDLEDFQRAEEFALVGARYFPTESVLHYFAGMARLRTGRDGTDALQAALEHEPAFCGARAALAVEQVRTNKRREALATLDARPPTASPHEDTPLASLAVMLRTQPFIQVTSAMLAIGGLVLSITTSAWFLTLALTAALLVAASSALLQRQLANVEDAVRSDVIRRSLRRMSRVPVKPSN